MAQLPRTVHFISKAPVLDLVRFLESVLSAQIAPAGSTFHIAVFYEVGCPFRSAGSKINCQQRFGPDGTAPGKELIGPELVRFNRIGGQIQYAWPVLFGTYTVKPVVA